MADSGERVQRVSDEHIELLRVGLDELHRDRLCGDWDSPCMCLYDEALLDLLDARAERDAAVKRAEEATGRAEAAERRAEEAIAAGNALAEACNEASLSGYSATSKKYCCPLCGLHPDQHAGATEECLIAAALAAWQKVVGK